MTPPRQPPVRTARAGSPRADVLKVLWAHRREHHWRPGLVWDPYQGAYVPPDRQTYWPSP